MSEFMIRFLFVVRRIISIRIKSLKNIQFENSVGYKLRFCQKLDCVGLLTSVLSGICWININC